MISTTKLCEAIGIPYTGHDKGLTDISCDSRKINDGSVFFDVVGNASNVESALSQGAALAITSLDLETIPPTLKNHIIAVPESMNVRLLFAKACKFLYPTQPCYLTAITGTNGKTSTVDFLRQLWQSVGYSAASMGTLGLKGAENLNISLVPGLNTQDALTFAKALQTLKQNNFDHVTFEASSHGLDQYRTDSADIHYAGFTNLTQDHLDYHGTMEEYFQAKARLFLDILPKQGAACINVMDPYGMRLIELCQKRGLHTITYGVTKPEESKPSLSFPPDISAQIQSLSGQGIVLNLQVFDTKIENLMIPVVGIFQVENMLCALGLALATTPFDVMDFEKGLSSFKAPGGRMDHVGSISDADIYVDYAHTPDALERALKSLRLHTQHKLYVVFGCGGDRDKGKRPIMGKIAVENADVVIVTDDNPRTEDSASIRKSVLEGALGALEIPDREEAIANAIAKLEAGDILLIAGKGHEQGQIIGDTVLPFCDKKIAEKYLQRNLPKAHSK